MSEEDDDLTIQEIEFIAMEPFAEAAGIRHRCRVKLHLSGKKTKAYTMLLIASHVPTHLRRKYLRRRGSGPYVLLHCLKGASTLYFFDTWVDMRDFLIEMGGE